MGKLKEKIIEKGAGLIAKGKTKRNYKSTTNPNSETDF